jgi:hypothetical protein
MCVFGCLYVCVCAREREKERKREREKERKREREKERKREREKERKRERYYFVVVVAAAKLAAHLSYHAKNKSLLMP